MASIRNVFGSNRAGMGMTLQPFAANLEAATS